MSKNWRIKKRTTDTVATYILQKRLLGFLWWYNPDNFGAYRTGVYASEAHAREAYRRKISPDKVEFLDI